MPSPIKRFISGYFINAKGVRVTASSKHPIYGYLRNGTKNKGGWVYHARNGKTYRVSIVSRSSSKSDASRASQNPYPVSSAYRHTGDWIEVGEKVKLQNYPSGKAVPPKKVKGKKPRDYQWRKPKVGKQRKPRYGTETISPAEKKLEEAKDLKKQAVAKKEAAVKAKTPRVKKEKAAEAEKLAKKSQTKAKAVVESKTAPKSVKEAAKATKRAAKKTEKSAKKVKTAAAKAGV